MINGILKNGISKTIKKGEKMKNIKLIILAFIASMVLVGCPGCNEVVPQGYVGMVKTVGGLTGEVLQPGHHPCWSRDKLLLVEMQEVYKSEDLSILCADDLNFKFTIQARCRPKRDTKTINKLLNDKGAAMETFNENVNVNVLKFQHLYSTYVQKPMIEIARGVVTKYETTQIRDAREKIKKAIVEQLTKATENSPMEITEIVLSNFDYPDEIENAMKKKKEREIAIETEKKEQAIKLLKADNRLKIAQKNKIVRAAEAEAEAAYMRIIGNNINQKFLTLKKIEADMTLYENVGKGDKVIMDGSKAAMMINTGTLK